MPDLSVVVTIVEGGPALRRTLDALITQAGAPNLEILVPFDDSVTEVEWLAPRYPDVRFVSMGRITARADRDAFVEHGLYERRRAAGLGAATAPLVAMLEDRGTPRPGWATAFIALHQRLNCAAIGGVVEHGGHGPLRWALYFSDFGRYQIAMPPGPAEYLSDVNICYRREALDTVRSLWEEIYQESTVNWALRRAGHELMLSPEPVVVESRAEARLAPVLRERMHWARIFAHVRGREAGSAARCLLWAAVTPLLPAVLFWRHVRRQLTLRCLRRELLMSAPALLLLLHGWALGECVGYVEAALRPSVRQRRAD